MAKRRRNGTGTVRLRKDGRWEARVVVSYDERGYPKTKSVLAQSKAECLEKLEVLKVEIGTTAKTKCTSNMPFGEWMDYWYQTYCKNTLKEYTQITYEERIYKQIIPKIGDTPLEFYEFYNLGLGDPIAVSSVHGHGTGDLLDAVISYIPEEDFDDCEEDIINVAVIGKPNAGKSSLINQIAGEERSIVSNIAGTTRDAIDTKIEKNGVKYNFIDTAGLRRKSKVEEKIEKYSVLRAKMAIERADVCVIMIDALDGFTEQDSKVAGLALEQGKACIIAVNKWDAVEKDGTTMDAYRKKLMVDFSFMPYAPIIFISAKTGQRVDRLFELIKYVNEQNTMRISTGMLNDILADATTRVQPPSDKGKRLKIYYMTQASTKPPTFVCFCNKAELFHFSYQRYLENQSRSTFGLEGTPVRFVIRERGDK